MDQLFYVSFRPGADAGAEVWGWGDDRFPVVASDWHGAIDCARAAFPNRVLACVSLDPQPLTQQVDVSSADALNAVQFDDIQSTIDDRIARLDQALSDRENPAGAPTGSEQRSPEQVFDSEGDA